MESKIKHRILGIVVVIGLIVILLPFFQSSNNESIKEAKLMKAPPFPDQSVQVSTPEPTNLAKQQKPDESINVVRPSMNQSVQAPELTQQEVEKHQEEPSIAQDGIHAENTASKHEAEKNELAPSLNDGEAPIQVIADPDKAVKPAPVEVKESITQEADIIKKVKMAKSAKTNNKPTTTVSTKPKFIEKALTENGLVELKNRTWVIQIGSFKNKANALRLVNQLRANGYPAFIQQLSGTKENTRVFVGPENKRKSANALAQKLEAELHLKAIVISYQPLSL